MSQLIPYVDAPPQSKATLKNMLICRVIGHKRQSVEIQGKPFFLGRWIEVYWMETHVSCSRCGKFIEMK